MGLTSNEATLQSGTGFSSSPDGDVGYVLNVVLAGFRI